MKKRRSRNQIITNQAVRNILSAIAVAVFGFILLNLTFLFDALYQGVIRGIIQFFIPLGPETNLYWFPPLMHLSFVFVIGLISWFVFKSKLRTIYKATYLAVPLCTVLVTIGMFFYHLPAILYIFGSLVVLSTLYYLYKNNHSWLYYYTVILFSIMLAIFTLTGGEI